MSAQTMGLVLFAALLHASWNALIRSSADRALDAALVAGGTAVVALLALPFLDAPAPPSFGFIGVSGAIHVVYMSLVGALYARGELGFAYPLMRGAAPLLTALAGALVFGERLSPAGWAGVLLTCGGVLGLAVHAARSGTGPAGLALLNAVVIAAYTLTDGAGARASGSPAAYAMWTFALSGPPVAAFAAWRRPAPFMLHLRARWSKGLAGGAASVAAYVLVLHAMTLAPVAAVAALRETAIVFALAISAFVLKERPSPARLLAALTVACGAVLLRVA